MKNYQKDYGRSTHKVYRKYAAYVSQESYEGRVIRPRIRSTRMSFRGRNCKTANYLIDRQALVVHAVYKSRMTGQWMQHCMVNNLRVTSPRS